MSTTNGNPYKIYWVTWGILLVITVAMLGAEAFHMPRWFLVLFLLAFMMVKATMIGGNFMHLRHEHRRLVAIVAGGLLVTSIILISFITPEAKSVRSKSEPDPAPQAREIQHHP
jgi:cytochrome c oxidase subunit IV